MNYHYGQTPVLLRFLMVNPLLPASKMIMMKVLSGEVFGADRIDLIILVYVNEIEDAEALKLSLDACAFSCTNSIRVSTDLPRISDADVFCFMTEFVNPNYIDFNRYQPIKHHDTFFLLIRIAYNFSKYPPPEETIETMDEQIFTKKMKKEQPKRRKPIFIADGLVALDILMSFSRYIPSDCLFCPTSIPPVAKAVLGDYLKVNCDVINDVLVWAANDRTFYVDVQKPILTYDVIDMESDMCEWKMISRNMLDEMKLEHTQFNHNWMMREFIERVAAISSSNPYGSICKSSEVVKIMKALWLQRTDGPKKRSFENMGVISDGTLGTIKGCPYVLPLRFKADTWKVDKRFEANIYLQYELKRINKVVGEHHKKLIPFCKKFLEDYILADQTIETDAESWPSGVSLSTLHTTASPTVGVYDRCLYNVHLFCELSMGSLAKVVQYDEYSDIVLPHDE